jgi:hypothetical protein
MYVLHSLKMQSLMEMLPPPGEADLSTSFSVISFNEEKPV